MRSVNYLLYDRIIELISTNYLFLPLQQFNSITYTSLLEGNGEETLIEVSLYEKDYDVIKFSE